MGMLPDRLPGYRHLADDMARAKVEEVWQTRLSGRPGVAAGALLADRGESQLKSLWLCRYDPVSTAFFGDVERTLQRCELVVVQHLFMTDTAQYAHVVLPSAAFGEERIQRAVAQGQVFAPGPRQRSPRRAVAAGCQERGRCIHPHRGQASFPPRTVTSCTGTNALKGSTMTALARAGSSS